MKISDLLKFSLGNLRRRKGRTALTVMGVVIGTCSIVIMVSFGVAINVSSQAMLENWGDLTKITVMARNTAEGVPKLDDSMVAEIAKLNHVEVASPFYKAQNLQAMLLSGKKDRYQMWMGGWSITGVYPEVLQAMGLELNQGDFITGDEKTKDTIYVMFGQNAVYDFTDSKSRRNNMRSPYPDENGNIKPPFVDIEKDDIIFRTQKMSEKDKAVEYKVKVKGVFVENWAKADFTTYGMVMDINVLKKIEQEYLKATGTKLTDSQKNAGYENVYVKVDDMNNVADVEKVIQDMGYQTSSMETERKSMQESTQTTQMILGALGAISLLVAAIGIANTMTMSIYERTKEIGVMKVLGCTLDKIRQMFLIEAGVIGFLGGIAGVGLSCLVSFLLNRLAPMLAGTGALDALGFGMLMGSGNKLSVIPVWLVLLGLIFATLIGLVSGIAPANKAVKISALEAIRHE